VNPLVAARRDADGVLVRAVTFDPWMRIAEPCLPVKPSRDTGKWPGMVKAQ
jgi:hypothetical protein